MYLLSWFVHTYMNVYPENIYVGFGYDWAAELNWYDDMPEAFWE